MRTWAEINLDALSSNYRQIRQHINADAKIMAIVKADAYGHGFLEVARTLEQEGVDAFAVALIEEGLQLRRSGFSQPILILGSIPEEHYAAAVQNGISLTVFSIEAARKISRIASALGKTAKIHIKLDTGMSRIGYVIDENNDAVIDEILKIAALDSIKLEGVFSHFSTADEYDKSYTYLQFKRFTDICEKLRENGLTDIIRHISNSAAIMMYPEMHLDMVRPGIILYGLYPSDEVDRSVLRLTPVMTLKAKITHIKTLPAGRGISYGNEYITDGDTRVATVPIGYADGYVRAIAKCGKILAGGKKVRILGRICMDQCMIDVTNVHNINVGDEVILFSDKEILADDVARWMGSINYEVVCLVSKRIPRIYIKNGEAVRELNFLKN
ncbi:MAG: alanine racemase [Clostridia bacterium]|nr:alanine racemase [Clostridia bacterium]